jgi:hypothetical protein
VRAQLGFAPAPGETRDVADSREALESVCGEIREGRIGPWPPATSWVADWMQKGRDAVEGGDDASRASRIESWIEEVTGSLAEQGAIGQIARHLDELAWIRSASGDETAARRMLLAADAISTDEQAAHELNRVRVESLFEPLLAELRVVETNPLDPAVDGETN